MSNHILNVTKIERDDDGDLVDYEYTIECPTGACGWIECREEHPCEDHPGGWEEDSDCEVCDPNFGDEHQFHDRDHEFMTFGWSVEYNREAQGMAEAVYIKYLDSPYHTDGDMIIGPCSQSFAARYQHVSANPVAIVTREQLTAEQLARTRPVLEVGQLARHPTLTTEE